MESRGRFGVEKMGCSQLRASIFSWSLRSLELAGCGLKWNLVGEHK